jgi:hypothetical protein
MTFNTRRIDDADPAGGTRIVFEPALPGSPGGRPMRYFPELNPVVADLAIGRLLINQRGAR